MSRQIWLVLCSVYHMCPGCLESLLSIDKYGIKLFAFRGLWLGSEWIEVGRMRPTSMSTEDNSLVLFGRRKETWNRTVQGDMDRSLQGNWIGPLDQLVGLGHTPLNFPTLGNLPFWVLLSSPLLSPSISSVSVSSYSVPGAVLDSLGEQAR